MECHCARRSLLSPAVWACGTPPQRPTETHAKTYSEHDRTGQDRSVHQSSKLMPKRPGICKLPDAPNHLELQRVGVGLLEPKMPLVDAKFACSGRDEWLRGRGRMVGFGGEEGGKPHRHLSTQLCRSVVIAGCTCQPTSQERVRVWGGVKGHRKMSLAGVDKGRVD